MASLQSRITINPKQCGGRLCIRGMRIRVVDVLDLYASGFSRMTIWIDAQISPAIAPWITQNFPVAAVALRDIGLRDAEDIFHAAKQADVVVMTKDSDFVLLLDRFGIPPQILWVTCGNTSNARLKEILSGTLTDAIDFLSSGERLVEIRAS